MLQARLPVYAPWEIDGDELARALLMRAVPVL
jgi:hypothetical protein